MICLSLNVPGSDSSALQIREIGFSLLRSPKDHLSPQEKPAAPPPARPQITLQVGGVTRLVGIFQDLAVFGGHIMPSRGLTLPANELPLTRAFARWCNGSTADSGSVCHGSNPCRAATPLAISDDRFARACSFAVLQDLRRLLLRNSFMEVPIAHHHRRRPATGETFHELQRVLGVARRLRPVRLAIQPQPSTKMFMQRV